MANTNMNAAELEREAKKLMAQAKKLKANEHVASMVDFNAAKDFMTELSVTMEALAKKHDVPVGFASAEITTRGIFRVSIHAGPNIDLPTKPTQALLRKPNQTQQEHRFEQYYRSLGLNKSMLHSMFDYAEDTYELLGLRGKDNKIVLQSKDKEVELSIAAFKAEAKPAEVATVK